MKFLGSGVLFGEGRPMTHSWNPYWRSRNVPVTYGFEMAEAPGISFTDCVSEPLLRDPREE